ncbi:MAG: DUF4375 domain-containing protein [Bacteroidetes bacterium]|nr:DUF4375 domain-containing protein [Bacteroidota bacterium]
MRRHSFILLGAMVVVFGCGRDGTDKAVKVPAQLTFDTVGRHVLTEKFIDTAADDVVLLAVTDDLLARMGNSSTEYATVMSWNKARRSVFVVWQLDAEVNHGGFDQFYHNPSVKFYTLVPEALKYVGASLLADLVQRANRTYEQRLAQIKKEGGGMDSGFSEYDHAYYQINRKESLEKILVEFVRGHKAAFVDP